MTMWNKAGAKPWLVVLGVATRSLQVLAQTQDPLLLGDDGTLVASRCTPLVVDGGIPAGEVCALMQGSNMEVTITAIHEECVLTETHVCNMPVESWRSTDGTKSYTYAVEIEQGMTSHCVSLDS